MENTQYRYHVTFAGEIRPGYSRDQVKESLVAALRLSHEKAAMLFADKKRVLKRTDSLDQATAFVRIFANAGAIAHIETPDGKVVPQPGSAQPAKGDGPAAKRPKLSIAQPLPAYRPFPDNWLFKPALIAATGIESLLTLLHIALLIGGIVLLLYFTLAANWLSELIPFAPLAALITTLLLAAGIVLLALLAKPLLGLIRRKEPFFKLNHEVEPEFFRYVDEIAELAGTSPPLAIRVNHTAMLTVRPLWTLEGIRGHHKVLTIGLPLLAGLDSQQLAALLVQALHPWRPGVIPFLGQILDSNIRWLHRAAFERDLLDRKLHEWQRQKPRLAKPLAQLERLGGWATRPARLRLRFSQWLSRRLIHRLIANADNAARQITGNKALRGAMETSRLLAFATQNTLPSLEKMWQEKGRLPDNLAQAIVARAISYPEQIQRQLTEMEERRSKETGGFKPTTGQRILQIDSRFEKGSYDIAAPCAAYFRRLEKLLHIMTVRYYHSHLHIPVTTNKLVRTPIRGSQEFEADNRIARFFGPVYADFVPLRLRARLREQPADATELARRWQQAVGQILAEQQQSRLAATTLEGKDDALIDVSNRELLQRAAVGPALSGLTLRKGGNALEQLQQGCRDAEEANEKALATLEAALKPYVQRLLTALALLNTSNVQQKMGDALAQYEEADKLLAVHERLENNYSQLRELRLQVILLESLLSFQAMKTNPQLEDRINELADDIRRTLTAFGVSYKQTPYPFAAEEHYRNLFDWILAQSVEAEGPLGDFDRGSDTFRRMALMQRLITGRLTTLALKIEATLGLKPAK